MAEQVSSRNGVGHCGGDLVTMGREKGKQSQEKEAKAT
jgi:hypothetical protein